MLAGPISKRLISLAPEIAQASHDELPSLLTSVEQDLSRLIASIEIASELHRYLDDASKGKAVPIEDGKQGEIVFHQDGLVFISLAYYDEPAKILHTHPVRGVFQVLQGEPFAIERFMLPPSWDAHDPSMDAALLHYDSRRICSGDSVSIDGTREVLWFRYESEVVVAKYIVAIPTDQIWAFDPSTLLPLDAESARGHFDALAHTADLLRAMQSSLSLDSLEHLAVHHPVHFVRWAGMRAVASISRTRGLSLLTSALRDPSRLVRTSAERALARATK